MLRQMQCLQAAGGNVDQLNLIPEESAQKAFQSAWAGEQADEGGEPDWAAEVPKGTGLETIPRVGGETSQQRLERSSKEVNLGGGLGQWQKSSVDNLNDAHL